MELSFQGEIGV